MGFLIELGLFRLGIILAFFWLSVMMAPFNRSWAQLRFALKTPENLKGAEKKQTLQKHPFGQPFLCTTPSPLRSENRTTHFPQKRKVLSSEIAGQNRKSLALSDRIRKSQHGRKETKQTF